jgi:hypothetical protein
MAPPEVLNGRYPSSSITRQRMQSMLPRGQDHQIGFHQRLCDLARLALSLFLLQRVDQLDCREEAHTFAVVFDGLDAEGCGNMGLSCARPTPSRALLRNTLPGNGSEQRFQPHP